MEFDLVWTVAGVVAGLLAITLLGLIWLGSVVAWGDRRTQGLAYFGLPPEGRERFRRRLRFHARLLTPIIRLTARASPFSFERASFVYRGVAGPRGTCTADSFRAGASYEPSSSDVIVVTQMRSGTTWMQYLLYELLSRGEGDLVDRGSTLNAISPWLESVIGVPVNEAPSVGKRATRLIKTHLPVSLCPWSERAKYVYVARHPVSCFASCVDFLAENLGPSTPSIEVFEAWFCSREAMWWGDWPGHVAGWWERSSSAENVHFLTFEAMLADLPDVVAGLTSFLGLPPLGDEEMGAVVRKTSFDFMRRHREAFAMYPPHILAVDSAYFTKGTADRHRDVPATVRERIIDWCRAELDGTGLPLDHLYPAGGRSGAPAGRSPSEIRTSR